MKGHWIRYSVEELAWLEANKTMLLPEYHAGFVAKFGRDDVSPRNLSSLRTRKGWKTGRDGGFKKGQVPHNKGVTCAPGRGGNHPNARKSHFRTGTMNGRARERYQPVGTERVNDDGYRERKVRDDGPRRWQLIHHLEWIAAHGAIPPGHALKCLGDRLNTDPSNWQLVPRAILPRLNGGKHKTYAIYDTAPADLKPTILLTAQVAHAVRERGKGASA